MHRPTSSIDELPPGYQTPVGERGLALSGGQRAWPWPERSWPIPCALVLLDDATSAVDSSGSSQVVKALLPGGARRRLS